MARSSQLMSVVFWLVVIFLAAAWENKAAAVEIVATEQVANLDTYGATQGSLHPQDCSPKCVNRCSATAYKKACMFFCEKCCATCLCVPPGTYGNKQVCPCYNNWKTKRGGPKCP